MFGRVLRAWPRLVAGMGLLALFIAFGVLAGHFVWPGEITGVIGAVAILLTVFICVAVPVAFLAILAPGALGLIELFLIAILLTIPISTLRESLGLPVWTDCIALVAFYLMAHQVLFGSWLTGLLRRDTATRRARFVVPDPIETVWARLAPLPENAGRYYWPEAAFMDPPNGSEADFILHAPRRAGLPPAVDAFVVEALDPGRSVTLKSTPMPGSLGVKERIALSLAPVGTMTEVRIEVTFLDVPLGHRIRLWLGNDARDFLTSLRYRARGRRDSTVHGRQVLPV